MSPAWMRLWSVPLVVGLVLTIGCALPYEDELAARALLELAAGEAPETLIYAGVYFGNATVEDYSVLADEYGLQHVDVFDNGHLTTMTVHSDVGTEAALYLESPSDAAEKFAPQAALYFVSTYALPNNLLRLWDDDRVLFVCPNWHTEACNKHRT